MLQHFIEMKRSDSSPPQPATKDEIMVDSIIVRAQVPTQRLS
jgi:hypothetical protein